MAINGISSGDSSAYNSVNSYNSTSVSSVESGKINAADQSSGDAPERVAQTSDHSETKQNKQEFEIQEGSRNSTNTDQDTREALKKAVDEINKHANNSEAQFSVHDETGRIMIKIIDKDTKEVLKEFPPEKTLDMIAKAWELAGLTVDERR